MENFRDKMRETFSTQNKTNSGRNVPFWSVLECFGVFWSGLWGVGGVKYLQKWHWSVCGNDRHSKAKFRVGCLHVAGLKYFSLLQSLQQAGTGMRVEEQ